MLEVRIALRPLHRMQIEYKDPHGTAPSPDHIFPLMFQRLLELFAKNATSIDTTYPPVQAAGKFAANWASVGIFDLAPSLAGAFQQGLLLALHRNQVADVYVLLLFNDAEKHKQKLEKVLASIHFNR